MCHLRVPEHPGSRGPSKILLKNHARNSSLDNLFQYFKTHAAFHSILLLLPPSLVTAAEWKAPAPMRLIFNPPRCLARISDGTHWENSLFRPRRPHSPQPQDHTAPHGVVGRGVAATKYEAATTGETAQPPGVLSSRTAAMALIVIVVCRWTPMPPYTMPAGAGCACTQTYH
jgi:hypothetical protein